MFTGLVESLANVAFVKEEPPGRRLGIHEPNFVAQAKLGESIAINGCCLTLVACQGDVLEFEAGPETLRRTNLGLLTRGQQVNLERSLRVGDRLGGHFVTGHVDGIGALERRQDEGAWSTFWFRASAELARQMASKGSIAVDGVSLTLVDVRADQFSVALIPHTLTHTTLGALSPGSPVNLETDLLAKYVHRLQESG